MFRTEEIATEGRSNSEQDIITKEGGRLEKSPGCPFRKPRFDSLKIVPGYLTPSSGLLTHYMHVVHRYICGKTTHRHKKKS